MKCLTAIGDAAASLPANLISDKLPKTVFYLFNRRGSEWQWPDTFCRTFLWKRIDSAVNCFMTSLDSRRRESQKVPFHFGGVSIPSEVFDLRPD
jgi:hypothetical protein